MVEVTGSSPVPPTQRAYGIGVTHIHGMDESGVRFPVGPQNLNNRRDAGVDERGCLENSCVREGTGGSNPPPAAF